MNENIIKKQDNNWLVSFSLLVFALILSLLLFFTFSAIYGTLNPFNWTRSDMATCLILVFSILFPIVLNYVAVQSEINLEEKIEAVFDYKEFSDKKYLDALLTHYGNVATTGLFFMGLIFTIREHSEIFLIPFFLALFSVLIFFIYSLYMFRLAMGMAKYGKWVYFTTVFCAVFFDMKLIEMFILSVPKA
ncbi:hypothetical protein [Vibrio proteolyticus]